MAKKHMVLAHGDSRHHKVAQRTLAYVGKYPHGGDAFSDLGVPSRWREYQREMKEEGLPAAKD